MKTKTQEDRRPIAYCFRPGCMYGAAYRIVPKMTPVCSLCARLWKPEQLVPIEPKEPK